MAKKRKADEPLVEGANNGGQAPMQSEALESKGSRRKKATQARTLRACDRCQVHPISSPSLIELTFKSTESLPAMALSTVASSVKKPTLGAP